MSLQLTRNFNKNRWVGAFLLAGGLAMFVGGIWYAREAAVFLETTQKTAGMVLELKRERGVRGMRQDHPIVRFIVSETGREAVFKSKVGLWPSPFEVGEAVEVAYNPDDPQAGRDQLILDHLVATAGVDGVRLTLSGGRPADAEMGAEILDPMFCARSATRLFAYPTAVFRTFADPRVAPI